MRRLLALALVLLAGSAQAGSICLSCGHPTYATPVVPVTVSPVAVAPTTSTGLTASYAPAFSYAAPAYSYSTPMASYAPTYSLAPVYAQPVYAPAMYAATVTTAAASAPAQPINVTLTGPSSPAPRAAAALATTDPITAAISRINQQMMNLASIVEQHTKTLTDHERRIQAAEGALKPKPAPTPMPKADH